MLEATGNLWDWYNEGRWICITTNGCVKTNGALVMGRGCAREASERLPELPHILGRLVTKHGNHAQIVEDLRVISFPVKHDWREIADPSLVERSAGELMKLIDELDRREKAEKAAALSLRVYLPRPGCGNGNLEWEHVRCTLADILDDRVTVVTFA